SSERQRDNAPTFGGFVAIACGCSYSVALRDDGTDPRVCPLCGEGGLHLKTSRSGGFVGCSRYPECRYTRPIGGEAAESNDRILGEDAGDEISLRSGRFGPYVQRGEPTEEIKKPPRASLPKGLYG
ncbi:MAG: topoisomerase DNA-binding C4 zinc finger domain-containing protein, partial [Pseudomonadota bacterium]